MSGDKKKVINPLLNASITGGTLEDFAQHAILLPAAELPKLQGPPEISSAKGPSGLNYNESGNFPNFAGPQDDQLHPGANQFENIIGNSAGPPGAQYSPGTHPGPYPASAFDPRDEQSTFGSVISSFSSYLNLGGKPYEPLLSERVPSVVDYFASADSTSETPQVQLYSSNASFPVAAPLPPQGPPTGNTFRRGGLKRPTYAPIPGLAATSSSNPAAAVQQVPQNLPPFPPKPRSPLIPSVPQSVPLRTSTSPALVETPAFDATTRPFVPLGPQILSPTDNFGESSAFLHPVPLSEVASLQGPSIATFNSSPTIHIATSTQQHPALMNPTMSKGSDVARSSPSLQQTFDLNEQKPLSNNENTQIYRPVYHHWFYKKNVEAKVIWCSFSMQDSLSLETAYLSNDLSPDKVVATDGGRYDVNILRRERTSVYWESANTEVRRCSWFHKGNNDGRYVPYEESVAAKLEEEFKSAFESKTWNRKVELPNSENVVFHGPDVLVLFPQTQCPDSWGNTPNQPRPRVVKRGMDEFHIDEGEPTKVDHVLFMVHGIGSFCDLKFRCVEEVVDDFRSNSLQLTQSHYKSSCEKEIVNRIEILPVSWHAKLHSGDTGVDKKLKGITLESIPKLRSFANDTILDVLFYTSPVYAQVIISSVANEINRLFELFKSRNPTFSGGASLCGHSLGSLILFDILCHQHANAENSPVQEEEQGNEDMITSLKPPPNQRKISRRISYMMGEIGTGQPQLNYPQLSFHPGHFFALGSPIGMYVTVRGLDTLGDQFALPTCPHFYNIFHPYDPVAYRIEALVNPELANLKPVLIPHHKGRKRMHLELKETMARVGADLKQKLVDSIQSTWNSFYQFKLFKSQNSPHLEEEVDKVIEQQLSNSNSIMEEEEVAEESTDLILGILNQGRRVDYVLQEAPLESLTDYVFALTSHVCYWDSQDTMLMIIKEIYNSKNVSADTQIPQQSMTIERTTSSSPSEEIEEEVGTGFGDPTRPISVRADLGPPPMSGFVKKT